MLRDERFRNILRESIYEKVDALLRENGEVTVELDNNLDDFLTKLGSALTIKMNRTGIII